MILFPLNSVYLPTCSSVCHDRTRSYRDDHCYLHADAARHDAAIAVTADAGD